MQASVFVGKCGCIELIVPGAKRGHAVTSGDATLVKDKRRYGRKHFCHFSSTRSMLLSSFSMRAYGGVARCALCAYGLFTWTMEAQENPTTEPYYKI